MPAAIFGPVLKELRKQFRAVVMPILSLNAAAMVFDGAECDAQPCAGMLGFLPHGLSWPLLPPSRGALWLFLPHLGDTLRGMGYILHCTMEAFAHGAAANRH